MGKNNWLYRKRDRTGYSNLEFLYALKIEESIKIDREKFHYTNSWGNKETCIIGTNYQISKNPDAVRTLIAPHAGKIRIEGTIEIEKDRSAVPWLLLLKTKMLSG